MSDLLVNLLPTFRLTTLATPTKSSKRSPKEKARQAENVADVAVQPLSRAVKGLGDMLQTMRDGLTAEEREGRRRTEERRQILMLRMKNAETSEHWTAAAEELDLLEGNDAWKLDESSGDYNPELISMRLAELDEARINCDVRSMMYLVRTALSRDLGAMGNSDLYRHSHAGTKRLIERYVDAAVRTIEALVEKSALKLPEDMSHKDLLDGVLFARQSFGRSALLLSGGGTFGMMHIGVLKALFEAKLMPRIISGASAGSIVCAVLCTRTDEEIPHMLSKFPHGDLAVFEEEGKEDTLLDHLGRLLTQGSWSDIKHLTRVMRLWLGDITFQEAYNRTRRILNICVSTASIYELPRLLNYITSPNVMIWSAVAASCSVPLIFNSAPLLVKDPLTGEYRGWDPTPQRWMDGSVDNDLPMMRLAEMFNVNHFIVSQVNPHVVPFLSKDEFIPPPTDTSPRARAKTTSETANDWLFTVTTLARDEALHRMQFIAEMGILPNTITKLRSVLSQRYSGDINILPEVSVHDLPRIIKNPTPEFMERACLVGERATWPRLSRVRDRCAIELALDRAVHDLRARVVFSKSQVDLRRLVAGSMDIGGGRAAGLNYGRAAGLFGVPVAANSRPLTSNKSAEHHVAARHHQPQQYPHRLADDPHALHARKRRSSGSSVQLLTTSSSTRRRVLHDNFPFVRVAADGGVITDDETEEEERLELSARRAAFRARGASPGANDRPAMSKTPPRLRRQARSHFNVPQLHLSHLPHLSRTVAVRGGSFTGGDGGMGNEAREGLSAELLDLELGPRTMPTLSSRTTAVGSSGFAHEDGFDFSKPLPYPAFVSGGGAAQPSDYGLEDWDDAAGLGGHQSLDSADGISLPDAGVSAAMNPTAQHNNPFTDHPHHNSNTPRTTADEADSHSNASPHLPQLRASSTRTFFSPRLDVLSPTDEPETSELHYEYSSDADAEAEMSSRTDEESVDLRVPDGAEEGEMSSRTEGRASHEDNNNPEHRAGSGSSDKTAGDDMFALDRREGSAWDAGAGLWD